MAERAGEVLAALRARISEQGDMHISVSHRELDVLREALGIGWWENADDTREIDAMALEMLIVAAENRSTLASEREAIGRAAGREEALREIKEPTDKLLDRVGEAMTRAQCPGREGPYGGYDYGHDEEFYGPAPKDGRYVVRDFRVVGSATWGTWVHQTPDREKHEDAFDRLTKRHVARAALLAALPVDGGKDGAA